MVICMMTAIRLLLSFVLSFFLFFFSSRRRHTRYIGDWSSDVCSSDLDHDRGRDARFAGRQGGAEGRRRAQHDGLPVRQDQALALAAEPDPGLGAQAGGDRSEERRVGKECRCRWWTEHSKEKKVKQV